MSDPRLADDRRATLVAMAVHTRHPVGPSPTAPEREATGHLLLRAYTTFVLFVALATTFWFNLLGVVGLAVLLGVTGVVSAAFWIARRPFVDARRLPWFALAYVAFACASLIWTHWLQVSVVTWLVLAVTTFQGLFIAAVLTWHELVRSLSSALKWVLGLSLVFEVWVALFVPGLLLPNFLIHDGEIVDELAWSRGNLFDWGERIQGIVGNAHLLAIAALLGIIVFGVRLAAMPAHRGWLIAWIVLASFLLVRANSATVWLALIAVLLVLGTVLLMRTTKRAGERTRYYALYAGAAVTLTAAIWFGRDVVLTVLGKTSDLTRRGQIWSAVAERAAEHPVLGWGFASPWMPWDPAFDGWIVVNDLTVFHAHNMWLDALFQLGWIGVVLLGLTYLAFIWRSWFIAVDRPRWDLVSDRPYQSVTLLPTLIATVLLVQGVAESRPLMEWGWMLLVAFAMKIKQSPLVGEGPSERRLAMERGERIKGP